MSDREPVRHKKWSSGTFRSRWTVAANAIKGVLATAAVGAATAAAVLAAAHPVPHMSPAPAAPLPFVLSSASGSLASPAHASTAGAQAASVVLLANLASVPGASAATSHRNHAIAPRAVLHVTPPALHAELGFRATLAAVKCGRDAKHATTIPPPAA